MSTEIAAAEPRPSGAARRRLKALIRKETRQLVRDKSNLLVGIVLPLLLILIFGYGLSFDVKHVPIAIVMEDPSPAANDIVSGLYLSPYFTPTPVPSFQSARDLMLARKVDGILTLPSDLSRKLAAGDAHVQLIVNGIDANRARVILGFAQAAITQSLAGESATRPPLSIEARLWFNEANDSSYFLVPGLIVLIMTLIGAFLTALVVAREWERGTLEALFVTPVRSVEILISKLIPYFVVGMLGLLLCLVAAKFLFQVPIRGSLTLILLASTLYLLVALGMGLLISSTTKNQFLASQIALIASFMPALILSGFLFDLRSLPPFVRGLSRVLPATYYVELLQTLFLAGNSAGIVLRDCAVLALDAVLLLAAARHVTRKSLD
jgi:ABC-2 type transport system permease protein